MPSLYRGVWISTHVYEFVKGFRIGALYCSAMHASSFEPPSFPFSATRCLPNVSLASLNWSVVCVKGELDFRFYNDRSHFTLKIAESGLGSYKHKRPSVLAAEAKIRVALCSQILLEATHRFDFPAALYWSTLPFRAWCHLLLTCQPCRTLHLPGKTPLKLGIFISNVMWTTWISVWLATQTYLECPSGRVDDVLPHAQDFAPRRRWREKLPTSCFDAVEICDLQRDQIVSPVLYNLIGFPLR